MAHALRCLSGRQSQTPGEPLDRRPLHDRRDEHREEHEVEEADAPAHAVDHGQRRQHDRHPAPQARPGDERALAGGQPPAHRRHPGAERARGEHDEQREHRAAQRHAPEAAREHEQAEGEEHPELGDRREAAMEGGDGLSLGQLRVAEREPGDVDREEAGALERAGRPERDRRHRERRHELDPGRSAGDPAQRPRRQPPDHTADHQPDPELSHEEPDRVERRVPGPADDLDHDEHQHHRHRIVEPGLTLERQPQAARERDTAQQREHRRSVGGAEDRSEQQALGHRQSEQPVRAQARDDGRQRGSDRRQRDRRAEHRAQDLQPGREAALEQDHEQRDRAHEAREPVVVEVDPAQPVGADRHPDAQEQHERGQPQARGEQRRAHPGGEQRACDQDQVGIGAHLSPRPSQARVVYPRWP